MIALDRRALLAEAALLAAARPLAAAVLPAPSRAHQARIADLLRRMTIEEKVGQLVQLAGGRQRDLNSRIDAAALDLVRTGGVGSYLHVAGAEPLRELQRVAVEESRLGIPLLFAMDVVHGYRTIFPVPLAMAATWDPALVEETARMAAAETRAAGIHWTFAPMVDIGRDPRWGRVVEGAGEDVHLGSAMAVAQVRGFQDGRDSVLACAKHFGAYGAAAAGRDYDSADVSRRTLHEVYLPPFRAAIDAGAATMMTAFNDIGGVPTTANADLVRRLLREEWGYQGLVVSDWNAVPELQAHGVADTPQAAAALALRASVDMDMASGVYRDWLKPAVAADPALVPLLDEAVGRVLAAKARAGLFDAALTVGSKRAEQALPRSAANRRTARAAAARAIVLLRNDGDVLPLAPDTRVALIGTLADDASSTLGSWRARGQVAETTTLRGALTAERRLRIDYHAGDQVEAAVAAARTADVVLLAIGEDFDLSGEARSRSAIDLPGNQRALLDAVKATGKPLVVILSGGRPLALDDALDGVPAVLQGWFLGLQGGPAMADVLTGRVSPGGRLPIGMPRRTGQLPMTYAHLPSGRPASPDLAADTARYRDVAIGALFPFGHGLSYGRITYADLRIDRTEIAADGNVRVGVTVTNTGTRAGDEVVQLYIRDPLARVARPVAQLRGFARVSLPPGGAARVTFTLSAAQFAIWTEEGWTVEPGRIDLMVGASSADIRLRGSVTVTSGGIVDRPAAAVATPVSIERVRSRA